MPMALTQDLRSPLVHVSEVARRRVSGPSSARTRAGIEERHSYDHR
jgi:hypothetical protein